MANFITIIYKLVFLNLLLLLNICADQSSFLKLSYHFSLIVLCNFAYSKYEYENYYRGWP